MTLDAAPAPRATSSHQQTSADNAVEAACGARARWRHTTPDQRASALRAAAVDIRTDAELLGRSLTSTTGRLLGEAIDSATVAAALLEEAAAAVLSGAGRSLAGAVGNIDEVRTEPRGVVAVITPWNDPFPAATGLLGAALATGNVVVHKPSERSSAPSVQLAERLVRHLPEGVLGVVEGDGTVGAALAGDPRVDVVAHIGSTATGRAIAATVGQRGGRVVRENGGKDPLLVDSGVDPVWAAEQITLGAFANAGQLCTSVERVYLHEAVVDDVLAELVRLAERLRPGPPEDPETTLARMVDERQLGIVAAHVEDALSRGATCLTGGHRHEPDSLWFSPTVLTGCRHDMVVMREETFGPVAPVMVVQNFDEALHWANTGEYGLAATVLTPRLDHALRAADELDVGTVKVNAVFGGAPAGSADPRRGSGSGCGFGPELLRELTAVKAVHIEDCQVASAP